MLAVMVVPTGIGAEIGGHSGDATGAAHLLAACCDRLILHPNVVNASDLTEQPANSLYVEGSMLDAFLNGEIRLRPVRQNHILVVCNTIERETVNCVNAMRSILGISAEVVQLRVPLVMTGRVDGGRATGDITGVEELVNQVDEYDYDALAIHTPIAIETAVMENYVNNGGINPWGGVEAKLSKELYWRTGKPNAHAPVELRSDYEYGVTDARLAPEMICAAHLGCVLRGLHKAPRSAASFRPDTMDVGDVDVMISSMCWGAPHKMCREHKIPMIFVEENDTEQSWEFHDNFVGSDGYVVSNYLEAAGLMVLMRMGRSVESIRRPLDSVLVSPLPERG
jgi:hypothetical protein